MRITDKGMTVELNDKDPRAAKVRAILFQRPEARRPVKALWVACGDPQRQVLAVLARHGEVKQVDLERLLRVDGVALRGRHSGLARIAKRLSVEYPVRSNQGRRESRRFWLEPDVAAEVLALPGVSSKRKSTR